mgnify:CR=1 FL=1
MTTSEQNKNSYQLNQNSDEQETNMAHEKTSVERAISDLRRGALVMLFDPLRRTAAIIQAAELSTTEGLDLILKLAGSEPSVVITNPAANQTVSGIIDVTAAAYDDIAIDKVEFYHNGEIFGTDNNCLLYTSDAADE